MSSSQYLNIKSTHGGVDVHAGGDEKQKFNFAWPYGWTRDAHACLRVKLNYHHVFRNAESSKWLQALASERQLWNRAWAAPWKRSSRKGKCQRTLSKSGNRPTRRSISRWHGYVLKWTIKTSLLCLCFSALFVGGMRLEYAGSKISPGHGSTVQATIKLATSPTTPTANHTRRPWCTIVRIRPKAEMSRSLATAPSLVVFSHHLWIQLSGSKSRKSLILALFLQKNIFPSWNIQQSMN